MTDSHTHLSDKQFNSDRDIVIKKAKELGIKKFLEVLTSKDEWELYSLFKDDEDFYFAFGIHPHYSHLTTFEDTKQLQLYLKYNKAIAIGETGIDIWYQPETLTKQLELFDISIEIAHKINKPLILHIRNSKNGISAYKISIDFLSQRKNKLTKKGIVHSFSGDIDEAKKFIDLGFFIGINATITYPKNQALRDIVKILNTENLLTETDSPYLPSQRIRGKRNDPSSVRDIIQIISEIKRSSFKDIEEIIDLNFSKFLDQSL